MKVRVSFTVDIDPEAWAMNYGVEGSKEIRTDMQTYVENGARDQLRNVGVLMED